MSPATQMACTDLFVDIKNLINAPKAVHFRGYDLRTTVQFLRINKR